MPKKRAKKRDKKVEAKPEFAYTVIEPAYGEVKIRNSANAWWLERTKVELVINAFKHDATVEESAISAGITRAQLKYFMEVHEEFSPLVEACRNVATLIARESVIRQMKNDGNLAFKYLERKRPSEFAPKPPIMAVQINMAERMSLKKAKYSTPSEVAGALPHAKSSEK